MAHKILIVDDEKDILDLIEICLSHEGYQIIKANDGLEAVELLDESIDLVLMDIMMPRMDGLKACVEMRKKSSVPIIFLTAKTQDTDQIFGLQVGADDYIKKPFAPAVLSAKVKATLRRSTLYKVPEISNQDLIQVQDLVLDAKAIRVTRDGQLINLTKTEYDILFLLLSHRGQIFSIARIYESIWNEPYFNDSANTVMVHIKRLRKKIDESDRLNPIIQTVWGVGYKIE